MTADGSVLAAESVMAAGSMMAAKSVMAADSVMTAGSVMVYVCVMTAKLAYGYPWKIEKWKYSLTKFQNFVNCIVTIGISSSSFYFRRTKSGQKVRVIFY